VSAALPATAGEGVVRPGAPARSAAFALFSRLVGSPYEAEDGLPPSDLPEALRALEAALPYHANFTALIGAAENLDEAGLDSYRREYGALFDVGSEGPPLPLREEAFRPGATGVREEVVRFHDHFGYALAAEHAWGPDHLAVELEFAHLLAFRESGAGSAEEAASFARAGADFVARHLLPWVLELAPVVERQARHEYLRTVFATLGAWLRAEHEWNRASLPAEER
jgi:DMSO reductase family type II enzyme chaperone